VQSSKDILSVIIEKYNSIEGYKGTIKLGNETYKIIFKKPNKYFAESNSSIIYSNGETVWIYDKRINSVYKGKDTFDFLNYGIFLQGKVNETEDAYIIGNLIIDKSSLLPKAFDGIEFNITEIQNVSDETFELFPLNFNISKVKNFYRQLIRDYKFKIYYPTYTLNITPSHIVTLGDKYFIVIYEYKNLAFIHIHELKLEDNLLKEENKKYSQLKKVKIDNITAWLSESKVWKGSSSWKTREHTIYKLWFTKDGTLIVIDTNILDEDEIIKIAKSFKPLE
jgi:hypothetical protein